MQCIRRLGWVCGASVALASMHWPVPPSATTHITYYIYWRTGQDSDPYRIAIIIIIEGNIKLLKGHVRR